MYDTPVGVSEVIRILDRLFTWVQGPSGIAAVGICVDHRDLLIFRIHRLGETHVKVTAMLFHILTSPVIVSLH